MGVRLAMLGLSLAVGMSSCSSTRDEPDDNPANVTRCKQPRTQFLPKQGAPTHLMVVDAAELDVEDRLLLVTLQGNVNRTQPRIYAINGTKDGQALWLDDYKRMYGITYQDAPGLMDLVTQFSQELSGVIINDADFSDSINLATTLAGIHGALVVSAKHLRHPTIAAMEVIEDLRGKWDDAKAMYTWMMEELWPKCNPKTIAAQHPETLAGWMGEGGADLRDYLVANKIFTFYRSPVGEEKEMLEWMMDQIPDDLPVLGYLSIDGAEEVAAQQILNERNKWLIPTHNAQNLSVHSGVPANIESLQALGPNKDPGPALNLAEIESHLVVTAALSDYDNYQVPLESGRQFWEQPTRGTIPIAWGIPGTALTLTPGMVEYFYQTRTSNDSFMLPTSLGFFTPSLYSNLDWIAKETTKTMCALGLDVMYPLDSINGMVEFSQKYQDSLVPFTEDFEMRGFFLNYFPTDEQCCITGPKQIPYCYTATSYHDGQGAVRDQIEQALAARKAGEPSFLFLGLNGWHYHPDRVLSEFQALSEDDQARVKWVTQERFFEAIRLVYKEGGQNCPAPDEPLPACQAVEVPCEAEDRIDLKLPKTSVILDPLDGVFECPEGLGTLLPALLPKGSVPPLLFGYQKLNGEKIDVLGAFATDAIPPIEQNMNQPSLNIPKPADWSCNPYIVLELDQIELEISGFVLNITNLKITGKLDLDGNFSEGTLGGIINPAPLAEEIGFNVCDVISSACNAEGLIEVLITGLAGEGSDVPVVEVSK